MTKLTYEDCLLRAAADFKDLVIYFCVARAKRNKDFFENGTFSSRKLVRMFKFVESWKKRTSDEKKLYAKRHATYSKALNYAFGIDSNLVKQVLGRYVDAEGKKVCIKIDDVLSRINKNKAVIKEVNAGRKFEFENGKHKKDSDGKSIVKCYWRKKYLLANKNYWFSLLDDEKYSDVRKFASSRLQKIVFDWLNGKFDAEENAVEEPKEETKEETKKEEEELKPITIYELVSLYNNKAVRLDSLNLIFNHTLIKSELHTYDKSKVDNTYTDEKDFWKRLYLVNCKNKNFCNAALKEVIEENYKKTNKILSLD